MAINIHSITLTDTALDACHLAVAEMVPAAIARAIAVYLELTKEQDDQSGAEKDPKVHQAYQAACKAALQHIEILMKLAAASNSQKTKPETPDISALMAKADQEVKAYQTDSTDMEEETIS